MECISSHFIQIFHRAPTQKSNPDQTFPLNPCPAKLVAPPKVESERLLTLSPPLPLPVEDK